MNPAIPSDANALLSAHGLRPRKRWGQNFLCDQNVLNRIAGAAALQSGDHVLEIGPGLGGLTRTLAKQCESVTAVEIDPLMEPPVAGTPPRLRTWASSSAAPPAQRRAADSNSELSRSMERSRPTFRFEPDPQGKFMLSIMFGQSKYYVDSLSENTKRGLREKVRRGEYPGPAPLGYLNDYRTKKIIVDRERAPIVREAFERYATEKETHETLRGPVVVHYYQVGPYNIWGATARIVYTFLSGAPPQLRP